MILPQELRVGNIVRLKTDSESEFEMIDGVNIMQEKPIHLAGNGVWNFAAHIAPVALTSEILEACGFEWETSDKHHLQIDIDKERMMYLYFNEGVLDQMQLSNNDFPEHFFADPPQYLHQLQNLYFALTGTELEIKQLAAPSGKDVNNY